MRRLDRMTTVNIFEAKTSLSKLVDGATLVANDQRN